MAKKEDIAKKEKNVAKIKEEKNKIEKKKRGSFTDKIKKMDENRKAILCFVVGLVLGLLILFISWPDRIATLKDGTQPVAKVNGKTITADDLYTEMKQFYSVNKLIDSVDRIILEKKYPEDDKMNDKVKETAESYMSYYKENYKYTEEQFLSSNGFSSYDEFIDYLKLDYRRNLYFDKYLEDQISDEDVQKYYDESVFGDINCQHILVATDDETDSDAAKKKANEIIKKLNDGTSWDDVVKEYGDDVTFEDLGYQAFNASLEDSFMEALKGMSENSYSDEPVETSYGYHVIHRLDQKEKANLKDIKDDVVEKLKDNLKKDDENAYYKALIKMRDDAKLSFIDSDLNKKYKEYMNQYE